MELALFSLNEHLIVKEVLESRPYLSLVLLRALEKGYYVIKVHKNKHAMKISEGVIYTSLEPNRNIAESTYRVGWAAQIIL